MTLRREGYQAQRWLADGGRGDVLAASQMLADPALKSQMLADPALKVASVWMAWNIRARPEEPMSCPTVYARAATTLAEASQRPGADPHVQLPCSTQPTCGWGPRRQAAGYFGGLPVLASTSNQANSLGRLVPIHSGSVW